MIPIPFDPFNTLGGAASKIVTDGVTAALLSLWNSGLWLLQLVLTIEDAILTPDVTSAGPGAVLYRTTYWVAGALLMILLAVQIGAALARRDGRAMGRILVGAVQFALVWGGWLGVAAVLLLGSSGLTHGLMRSLLNIDSWASWKPWEPFQARDVTDAAVAFVLGIMGLLLWVAAIAHVLMMLARAGALLVLAAVGPISAAGLVSDAGSSWFWKTLRWFLAAAFAPPVVVMMLGIGVQLTSGVANGLGTNIWASLGTAFIGVILICVSTFSPLALFKLLAFVDPGTTSGSALRAGISTAGGIQGLLSSVGGGAGQSDTGTSQAAAMDDTGKSAGESSAEAATTSRFSSAMQGGMAVLGPVGQAAAAGLGIMTTLGQGGAAMGADLTNQMGVGHNNYPPDMSSNGRRASSGSDPSQGNSTGSSDDPAPSDGADGSGQATLNFAPPTPPASPSAPAGGAGKGGGGAAAAGRGATAAETAEAAAVVL